MTGFDEVNACVMAIAPGIIPLGFVLIHPQKS
jgi:hypothetical protein